MSYLSAVFLFGDMPQMPFLITFGRFQPGAAGGDQRKLAMTLALAHRKELGETAIASTLPKEKFP